MKFGLHYHQHILAKWADHYVDYNGLRSLMRSNAEANDADVADVMGRLNESIKEFETFRQQRYASISKSEGELRARFRVPENPNQWRGLAAPNKFELKYFQQCYETMLFELRDLQHFNAINETAILGLFDKLPTYFPGQVQRCQAAKYQWLTKQQDANKTAHGARLRVFKFICALRQHHGHLPTCRTRISFGRAVLQRYTFPDGYDAEKIYELARDDDSRSIDQVLQTCIDPDYYLGGTFRHLLGDLLILGMLLEADNTLSIILERIIKGDFTMGTHHVSVILAIWRSRQKNATFDQRLIDALCTTTNIQTFIPVPGHLVFGNPPLHYAAQYGYVDLCKSFTHNVSRFELPPSGAFLDRDGESKTPLHHAVLSGSVATFSALAAGVVRITSGTEIIHGTVLLEELLLLAVGTNHSELTELILKLGRDLGYTSFGGEAALYCAAQTGSMKLIEPVVRYMIEAGINLDSKKKHTGWTPLMVACANGHRDAVVHLLSAGADPNIQDAHGWTAQEHAAFRGHLAVVEVPTLAARGNKLAGPASQRRAVESKTTETLVPGQKAIVVNLGSVQGGHLRAALQLRDSETSNSHGLKNPPALILEISTPSGQAKRAPLPILKDYTNEPFVFTVGKDVPPQLIVKVYRQSSPQSKHLLCGGTVLLNQDSDRFGEKRESMLREATVFMMQNKGSMEPAGTVLLSYVVVKAFEGLQTSHSSTYRRADDEPARLIGHRGLGMNTASQSSLQLGENTAMSFLSAFKLGASFIEFDLQLTRDLEAVIFHDFSLSELGTDIPIHDVTLAQYKHASSLQGPSDTLAAVLEAGTKASPGQRNRQRTFSTGEESMLRSSQLRERILHTVDFQNKGFKPNTRGHSIQDTLATLDELLVKLPEEVGFNIEMKYPRLHEALEAGVAPVTIDINTFVDTALEKIQRLAGRRPIILSSFTPEICILLKLKQKAYPVLFITNAGKVPMADRELRAASLQMGVQFAKRWNLDGIVLACETFLLCPRFIRFVQNAGLVCASYGVPNNDPANTRIQVDAGIDIIIADKVKVIAEELRRDGLPLRCK